jgi:predicted permease
MVSQLKVALRGLLRQPSFLTMAVTALALGIAAPTALFAVVEATLLRPLPYSHAEDVYTVRTTMTDGRFTIGLVASEELTSLRRATDLVTASALVLRRDDSFAGDSNTAATQLSAVAVSEGFFELFGMPMAQGRAFNADDYEANAVNSVVISSRLWQRVFGGDSALVGKTIRLASGPAVVAGIAPPAFDAPHDVDMWFASRFPETIGHGFDAYIRLRPGTTPEAVSRTLGPMWDALAKKYPDQARNRVFVFRPLLTAIVGDLGPIVLIAFAATALLLLLAIANVANLLVSRGAVRARELAVRAALGGTRWHLIRHMLSESLVIAVAASAVGIPLAYAGIRAIVAVGGSALPRVDGLTLDWRVALFATAVMIVAALTVGLLPALSNGDANLMSVANEGGRGGMQSRRTRRMLGAMVVCEVTLAVALVAGAGRLIASARNLLAVDPGFTAEGRLVIDVLLPRSPYGAPGRAVAWSGDVATRLRALGATRVGIASSLPLRREWDSTTFTDIVGRPVDPQFRPNARLRIVSADLFDALGIAIESGRRFTVDDRAETDPVVIVNRAWATKFLPGLDPLRERIDSLFFGRNEAGQFVPRPAPIVGVAANVRYASLDRDAEPVVYLVDTQRPALRASVVMTTADGHPERLVPQIRETLRALDPQVPVQFETLANVVRTSLVWSRLGVLLMATFGVVSLLLAGTGVFGVLAFVGAQRHGEMAVRLSLGATRGSVFRMMLAQGARLAMMGGAFGLALAWWMGRLMSSYVYQVAAANVSVLVGSALVVIAVALIATAAPARRAALVDPARALRP